MECKYLTDTSSLVSSRVARPRYDLPEVSLILTATGMAFAIFNAFFLDVAGARIDAWLVLVASLFELAILATLLLRANLIQIHVPVLDSVALAGIVLITVAYMIYPSLPALLPPSHHYDAVHPIALADYIYGTDSLPHDFTGQTPPYFPPGYPVGGALMVALVAHWLGRVPINTLHPFISFVLGLTAGLTFLMIRRVLRDTRFAVQISCLATLLLFTAWEYFPGLVNERYFFGQTFAQFFALLTFFYVIDYIIAPNLHSVILILASLAAILFSHPSPLVAPALVVAFVSVQRFRSMPRQVVFHTLLFAVGLGLVAYFYVLPRWHAWVGQTGYGEATPFSLESIGVILPLLGILGVVFALQKQWRGECWIGFLMLVAIFAQPIVLFLGGFFIQGIGTYYFEKSVYMLIYPLTIFAAVALTQGMVFLCRYISTERLGLIAWAISAISVPFIFVTFPPRAFAPLTQSELEVAWWARSNIDIENLAYVSPIREDAYWIQVAVFGLNPSEPSATSAYNLGSMDYAEWHGNPGKPDYAIIRNIARVPNDPTVTTIYRIGESAILRKPQTGNIPSPKPQRDAQVQFGDMFKLVGYDIADQWIYDSPLSVRFYWQPLRWPSSRMSMFIQILDQMGNVVARSQDEMFHDRFPTQRWPIGMVTSDSWTLPLDASVGPGDYRVQVAVLFKLSGERLNVTTPNVETANEVRLGPFRLIVPVPSADELRAVRAIKAQFGDSIMLQGDSISPIIVHPGDSFHIDLYWQSLSTVDHDYVVFVHLLDAQGHVVAQRDTQPQNGTNPTSQWRPNAIIKDPYNIGVPKDSPPGEYRIETGLYTLGDLKRLPVGNSDRIILPQAITVQ